MNTPYRGSIFISDTDVSIPDLHTIVLSRLVDDEPEIVDLMDVGDMDLAPLRKLLDAEAKRTR